MIRKAIMAVRLAIIIVLTLAAVVTWLVSLASTTRPLFWNLKTGRESVVAIGVLGGCAGAFWIQCNDRNILDDSLYSNGTMGFYFRALPHADIPWDVHTHWGFGIGRYAKLIPGGGTYKSAEVTAPLWGPFILFGAYPTVAFIRGPLRSWRRRRQGLCVKCGYNLTGLTEPRCPECGTEFDPSTLPPETRIDVEEG